MWTWSRAGWGSGYGWIDETQRRSAQQSEWSDAGTARNWWGGRGKGLQPARRDAPSSFSPITSARRNMSTSQASSARLRRWATAAWQRGDHPARLPDALGSNV